MKDNLVVFLWGRKISRNADKNAEMLMPFVTSEIIKELVNLRRYTASYEIPRDFGPAKETKKLNADIHNRNKIRGLIDDKIVMRIVELRKIT